MGGFRKTTDTLAEIKRMRVHPDFQGLGFGQLILEALEARAAALGYTTLFLDTSLRQVAAQHLYRKNGFYETHRAVHLGSDCIFFEKTIVP